jgi:hypothetical protein
MSRELLEQALPLLEKSYPTLARKLCDEIHEFLAAQPAPVPAGNLTPRRVAREVFAVCEQFEELSDDAQDSQEVERFKAGQRFAAKRIRTAIGIWLTDEEGTPSAAPVPVPPGWMPIESAPKDGRKIILTYRNANDKPRTVMAAWVTDEEAAETDEDGVGLEAGWYESIDNWDDYSQVAIHAGEPTHWMPLPSPPGIAASPEVP